MTVAATKNKPAGKAIFSLFNLGCCSCAAVIESRLKKLPGMIDVTVNYVTDTVLIIYDPTRLTVDAIRTFMKKLGQDAA